MKKQKNILAIDLFCGVGGLTNGLEKAGINVLAGYDFDSTVGYAYSENNNAEFIQKDITKLDSSEIQKMFDDASLGREQVETLIAGCAPCQPFSSYQKDKSDEARKSHYKYPAFEHFIRIVRDLKPNYVTMENVSGITKDDNFELFVNDLKGIGYHVDYQVVNLAKYGAPQKRRRMLLVASMFKEIKLPKKTVDKELTIQEAIGHLTPVVAGETNLIDKLHEASNLSPLNIRRIQNSRPGGTWRDWPQELLPECYKKESGQTFGAVYGRLRPDQPSNTLTTQFTRYGTGRYGHYEQDRALTLREGAIIQTFPENYDFNVEKFGRTVVARHIGNAVPPIAGEVIGKVFKGEYE